MLGQKKFEKTERRVVWKGICAGVYLSNKTKSNVKETDNEWEVVHHLKKKTNTRGLNRKG